MQNLMQELAEACDYCCIYSMLQANKKVRTGLLAEHLGVHRTTIQFWRRRMMLQKCVPCLNCLEGLFLRRPLPRFDPDAD